MELPALSREGPLVRGLLAYNGFLTMEISDQMKLGKHNLERTHISQKEGPRKQMPSSGDGRGPA
jgi:hypothetical protein